MLKTAQNACRLVQRCLKAPEVSSVRISQNSVQNCLGCGLKPGLPLLSSRELHASLVLSKDDERRAKRVPKSDDGTLGEYSIDVDQQTADQIFPDKNTPNVLIDGVKFSEIPVCSVRVSKNNTIFSIADGQGVPKMVRSCGMEGFKNAKKGTNVAAQATGISTAVRALNRGYKNVRVVIRGLGPGRMSSLKGLEMGGLNIVSITDATRVPWFSYPRPPKVRRL